MNSIPARLVLLGSANHLLDTLSKRISSLGLSVKILSSVSSPRPASTYQSPPDYLILASSISNLDDFLHLCQHPHLLNPLLPQLSKIVLLLPRRLYFPQPSIGYLDKLGHLLKHLTQFNKTASYSLKIILLEDLLDPSLPTFTTALSISSPVTFPNSTIPGLSPVSPEGAIPEILKLLFSGNSDLELLLLQGPQNLSLSQLHSLASSPAPYSPAEVLDLTNFFSHPPAIKKVGPPASRTLLALSLSSPTQSSASVEYPIIPTGSIPNSTPPPTIEPAPAPPPSLPSPPSSTITKSVRRYRPTTSRKTRFKLPHMPKPIFIAPFLIFILFTISAASAFALQHYLANRLTRLPQYQPPGIIYSTLNQFNHTLASALMQTPYLSPLGSRLNYRLVDWQNLLSFEQKLDSAQTLAGSVLSRSLSEQPYPVGDHLNQLSSSFESLYRQLSLLPSESKNLISPTPIDTASFAKNLLRSSQISLALGQVFHAPEPLKVLLVLQNNLELRPTGGFIAGVVSFNFDRGVINNLVFHNVYDLDAELNGYVAPPRDLKQSLGEEQWYFRDSNWDPDFYYSAQQIAWFYQTVANQTTDIVIGTNLYAFKNALNALGPVSLADGRQVTADNLFDLAQAHPGISSKEGGGVKQDFISLIFPPILDKAKHASIDQQIKLARSILESLNQNQLLLATFNTHKERSLISAGIAGTLLPPECPNATSSACLTDFLYLNEANVGINQANFSLSRQHHHQVTFTDSSARINHQTIFTNQSTTDTWPSGSYKAYLRWVLPSSAQNPSLALNQSALTPGDYEVKNLRQFKLISTAIQVPVQTTTSLDLQYELPLPPGSGPYTYAFLAPKQSGISSFPLKLELLTHGHTSAQPLLGEFAIAPGSLQQQVQVDSSALSLVELVK